MQSEGSFNSGRKSLPERNKDWVEHDVDLNKFQQLTPEYLKLNPNGVVPTLVHDGQPLIESSALLEYLEEIIPEPSLVPADSIGRAKMRAWMRYIDEVPTVAVRVPTFANIIATDALRQDHGHRFLETRRPVAASQAVLSTHDAKGIWQGRSRIRAVSNSSDE